LSRLQLLQLTWLDVKIGFNGFIALQGWRFVDDIE
jgi:hypothetical protein